MSEIQQHTMSREDAERLTERIRMTATSFMETRDKLSLLIRQAQEGQAHEALGFPSWTAYIAQVFSDTPLMRLTRDERRVIVSDLAEQGMSTRAIAPIVGVQHSAVAKDLRAAGVSPGHTSPDSPAEPTFDPTPDWDPVNTETGEIHEAPHNPGIPEPRPVTGLDGKTYTRPEPKETDKPKPEATTSQFSGAIADLNRILDRLHRIANSPNFPQNKNQVATLHGSDLDRAISELQNLADALN